ncbi:MAG: hypothetical protein Q4D71_08020, partial [Oscillospiraceae bacterium]|nr:hypothetical protein [Oscillospiraceae bacterium]
MTNLDSFRNPSGNALLSIIGIIIVLILSFLPVIDLRKVFRLRFQRVLSIILAFEIILVMAAGNKPSPLWGYITVAKNAESVMGLARNPMEIKDSMKMFFKPVSVSLAWVEKPDSLRDHPNIILIFTEGLSQSIVDDKRDIMPSIRKYEQSGLYFDNYYNHTFGEYKGIEGTLFSGYQLSNHDKNGLPSLQGILRKNEYYTEFINTQPGNRKFTSFLETLGFDSVKSWEGDHSSPRNLLSDQEAYERLFDEALLLSEKKSPFMLGIWT